MLAVSAPSLNHAVKGPINAAAERGEERQICLPLCLREDKRHVVEPGVRFILQTAAYRSCNVTGHIG